MDAAQYFMNIEELLEDLFYKKLKWDPTPATERKVLQEARELEKKGLIPWNIAMKLKPSASKPPKMLGLRKVHKAAGPSMSSSVMYSLSTYQLTKYVNTLIFPLDRNNSSFIKNIKHYVDSIKNPRLLPTEVMVNFDMKLLFTNVPVQEALEVIYWKLLADKPLGEAQHSQQIKSPIS